MSTEFFRSATLTQRQRDDMSHVGFHFNDVNIAPVARSSIYSNANIGSSTLFRRETGIHNMETARLIHSVRGFQSMKTA